MLCPSANYVSGFLMDHEALHQRLDNGRGIIAALRKQNLIPGIVVDKGILKGQFKGYTTDGIVGLIERCKHYKEYGCDFAKWRSVFFVRNESMHSLQDDARLLSRVAAKCQEVGMVPIIEIDIMPLGEHTIETAQNFFEIISSEVVKAFQDYRVFLEGTILRSSFITSGHNSLERLSPREIARSTLEAFSRTIPPAFGGIVLRGGGKSEEEATILLNEVNRQRKRKPWPITYAFGRSMQLSALKTWNGEQRYVMKAQEELLQRAKANSEATLGKYVTGSIIGMASEFTMPLIQDPRLY